MCGIAGAYVPGEAPRVGRQAVERMVGALDHRGPDDRGFHFDEPAGIGMGMTRLSIIDLAGGQQPISSEDGQVTVVCNGEIYNHAELRRELERDGHVFRTGSDVYQIIGVAEGPFTGTEPGRATDIFLPTMMMKNNAIVRSDYQWFRIFAQLGTGVNAALIGEELFVAGAYMGDAATQRGSVVTLDVLRWLLILGILLATANAIREPVLAALRGGK